jgi:acyl-CoA reductase-like NAD-dependent aldehyde dehydrogenase
MVDENRERLLDALKKDLNKPRLEALIVDINGVLNDITQNLDNLDEWTADVRPSRKEVINFAGKVTLRREPLGVTFIIGAWNFPVQLLLQPMVAAIASGCAMILKPSDVAVHCEQLLMELIPKYMDQRAIRCITAGPREMEHILQRRFNHIFYTGSSHVGKIIYAAAAKHLTPVTLELGGQGPAIVCKSADIDVAARRIAAGKFANAGQVSAHFAWK